MYNAGYVGADSFQYSARDESGLETSATMTIDVYDHELHLNEEQQVNTYTIGSQTSSTVLGLEDGGVLVLWTSNGQDGDKGGVYGQFYDALGNLKGVEFRINTYVTDWQRNPEAIQLSNGEILVTWDSVGQDGDSSGVFAQRISSQGTFLGPEFLVNTTTASNQSSSRMAELSNGNFLITWFDQMADNNTNGVFAQIFNVSGAKVGNEFQVNTFSPSGQSSPDVVSLENGTFLIIWQSHGNEADGYGIFGQLYNDNGSSIGTEFQLNTATSGDQKNPSVDLLTNGNLVVVWETTLNGNRDVVASVIDATGNTIVSDFIVNTFTSDLQYNPRVVATENGGFVVTWQSRGQDGDANGIYAQEYDSAANALNTEFIVNETALGNQTTPSITALAGGGYVISWQSPQDGDSNGIYKRYFGVDVGASLAGDQGDDILIGTGSSDALFGRAGDDQLIGGAGDDTLDGGNGSDTYEFNRGDDNDVISDQSSDGSDDKLVLASDIAHDQLWLQQSGDDLLISVIGTSDSVTVENWYLGVDNQIETIQSGDGKTLSNADVFNLVEAMASFSPPSGSETDLSDPQYDSLDSVLTANWQ